MKYTIIWHAEPKTESFFLILLRWSHKHILQPFCAYYHFSHKPTFFLLKTIVCGTSFPVYRKKKRKQHLEKLCVHLRVKIKGQAWLWGSCNVARCKSPSLKQVPSKYGRSPHRGLFLWVTSTKSFSIFLPPKTPSCAIFKLALSPGRQTPQKHSEPSEICLGLQQQHTNKKNKYREHLLQGNIHSFIEFSVVTEEDWN